jgi:hypothetical protein
VTTRLKGLEVQEVSLVDDPAVPEARYLITKRNTSTAESMSTNTKEPSLAERLGKAVFNMLGGQPADENTRALIAKHLADAEAEGESAEGEAEAEKSAEGAESEATAEAAESEEAEKASDEGEAEAESTEEEAEKGRAKCETCGQYLPEEGDDRHKSAEGEPEAAESEEAETEKAADEAEAEEAAPALTREDVASIVAEAMKAVTTQIESLNEGLTKSVEDIDARVEAMETRKGVSKSLKGNDVKGSNKGTFESLIFGG